MARLDAESVRKIEAILNKGFYCEIKAFAHGFQITEVRKTVIQMPHRQDDMGRDKRSVK